MKDCRICSDVNCTCLCNTCKLARILRDMPDYVYEMSDDSRRQWIAKQLAKP